MESETLTGILKVVAAMVIGVPLLVFLLQERLIFMPLPLSGAEQADIRTNSPKVKMCSPRPPTAPGSTPGIFQARPVRADSIILADHLE